MCWERDAFVVVNKNRSKVLAGKLGGLSLAATRDPRSYTLPARRGFLKRFWPDDPTLTPEEAERRAKAALRLHMSRLALKSAQARRKRGDRVLAHSPGEGGGADAE